MFGVYVVEVVIGDNTTTYAYNNMEIAWSAVWDFLMTKKFTWDKQSSRRFFESEANVSYNFTNGTVVVKKYNLATGPISI